MVDDCKAGGSGLGQLPTPGKEAAGVAGFCLGPGLAALERCWPCVEQWGFRAPGETFEVRRAGGCPVHAAVPVKVPCQGGLPCCQQHFTRLLNTEKTRRLWLGRVSRGQSIPAPCSPGRPATVSGRLPRKGFLAAPCLRRRHSALFWACSFQPRAASVSAAPAS